MDVNDNAFILYVRGAVETIASKLAPTKKCPAFMTSAGHFVRWVFTDAGVSARVYRPDAGLPVVL